VDEFVAFGKRTAGPDSGGVVFDLEFDVGHPADAAVAVAAGEREGVSA